MSNAAAAVKDPVERRRLHGMAFHHRQNAFKLRKLALALTDLEVDLRPRPIFRRGYSKWRQQRQLEAEAARRRTNTESVDVDSEGHAA